MNHYSHDYGEPVRPAARKLYAEDCTPALASALNLPARGDGSGVLPAEGAYEGKTKGVALGGPENGQEGPHARAEFARRAGFVYLRDGEPWCSGVLRGSHGAHEFGGLVHPGDTGEDVCPYRPECETCPAAGDDDVCLPHECPRANGPQPDPMNPKDALAAQTGKTRLDLLEPVAKAQIADALEDGARKYGQRNYVETPVRLRVYLGAIERHVDALKDGEDYAEDSGLHHLAHVGANVHIILKAAQAGTLVDDR